MHGSVGYQPSVEKMSSETNGDFGLKAFSSDVLINSIGKGLLLVFAFFQVAIIPKYLSVESYGYWQLFLLYAGYAGILHFGLIEGILLKWAGQELDQIDKEIGAAFRLLLLQLLITIIPLFLIFLFALGQPLKWILLTTLAYAFIFNMTAFFQYAAQAFKRFKGLVAVSVGVQLTFLIIVVCLLSFGYADYRYIVYGYLFAYVLGLAALAFWFRRYLGSDWPFYRSLSYRKELFSIGIFVYFGGLVNAFLLTVDRLTVSLFFPIEQFAIYAFALTVAMVAYTFVVAVSAVFFPYLSGAAHELRTRAYRLGKPAIILAWAAFLAVYFPVVWLIRFYLPHYTASLPIMQILLCTVGFGSLIQILHVNYYMAYRRQRRYFLCGVVALAILVILVFSAIKIWGTLESVAVATLISFGIWYIINELSLKSVVEENNRGLWKSFGIICSYVAAFWVSSQVTDRLLIQLVVYICLFALLTWLFSRNTIKELVVIAKEIRGKQS
jgi:O-antigen/teichoic acid export membrane protein